MTDRTQGANTVEPLRLKENIQRMKETLLHQCYRNYFFVELKVLDVRDKDYLQVHEKKNQHIRSVKMTQALKNKIEKYIRSKADSDFLFLSRKGQRPISRVQAWNILHHAAKEIGIKEAIGIHTLRKTIGCHFYQKTKDVAMLQQIFGHSSPSITLRYIGINDDMIDQALDDFSLALNHI